MAHPITRPVTLILSALLLAALSARPARAAEPDAGDLLSEAIDRWVEILEPPAGQPARTFTARATLVKAAGLDAKALGSTVDLAFQAPDLARASASVMGETYAMGRDGQQIWVHEPGKKFALLAKAGVQRFKADPASVDDSVLPPFALPVSRLRIRLALLMVQSDLDPAERIDGADCHVLRLALRPTAEELLGVKGGTARLWLRKADFAPARVTYSDNNRIDVRVDFSDVKIADPLPAERWKLKANADDHVDTVALSHLVKFFALAPEMLNQKIPTLGPATGNRKTLDTIGKGRLEDIDGTRVLFLQGTPAEMGKQHGKLLKPQIQDVSNKILYGVGVGSSFATGKWFFGEVEGATARLLPHMDPRYLAETDALGKAAGMHPQEARLSNFFPELFHCSGFAIAGKATADGHIYHGRVLDYMKGVGLEQNAVVVIQKPDDGRNAWVNLTYAGFVGSVTAMNEKGIAIGEMGGRGYGDWDGKPMAHLVREVMERANTLDEAVAIMKAGPRTCAYYYVLSDGKTKTAVGIAATPTTFETVKPGEAHPQLRHAIEDAVLLSAGDRYETLAQRVKDGYGKFDATTARDLMTRPVCMGSNIQSVLFRPDTLDFWVANADSSNVASHTRYTHYNLKELLKPVGEAAEVGF